MDCPLGGAATGVSANVPLDRFRINRPRDRTGDEAAEERPRLHPDCIERSVGETAGIGDVIELRAPPVPVPGLC
jgi:hypothetical protein